MFFYILSFVTNNFIFNQGSIGIDKLSNSKAEDSNSHSLYKTVYNSIIQSNNNIDNKNSNKIYNNIYNFNNNKNTDDMITSAEMQEHKQKLTLDNKTSSFRHIKKDIIYNSNINLINLNNSNSFNLHNNSTEDADLFGNTSFTNNNNNNIKNLMNKGKNNDYNNNNNQNLKSFNFDYKQDKERIIRLIEKLKAELKREKNRNQSLIAEFNVFLLEKKKLEKIFIDCVEDTRREIHQRKLRDTVVSTKSGGFFSSIGVAATNRKITTNSSILPKISEVKFENFQLYDKRRLIEAFLMNDEVINFIRDNLSSINPDKNNNNINNNAFTSSSVGTNFGGSENNNNFASSKGAAPGAALYAKNTMNESIFTLKQTMIKSEVAKFGFDDLAKSKNPLKTSCSKINFHK